MYVTAAFLVTVSLIARCEVVRSGAHEGGAYGAGGHGAGAYGAEGYGAAEYDEPKYHEPQAIPVVLPDGHIADTHEVAAAKGAHLSAVSKAAAHSGYRRYDDGSYAGAGYAGGYGAAGGYAGGYGTRYGYASVHGAGYSAAYDGPKYQGPTAIPVVLVDGHIADTHEVAAAKGAHYAALSKAKAKSHTTNYGGDYDGSHAGGYDSGSHDSGYAGVSYGGVSGYNGAGYGGVYHGPLAKPVVLPSGYLADTHDVAANKGANAAHSHAGWAPHGHH